MRVAVVTGSRADYGLLRPTISALRDDPGFELVLLVTAMHLDADGGDTLREIEADGHPYTRVPILHDGREPGRFARRLGAATTAFTETLSSASVDLLLVLGDRFEVLGAALAGTGLGIPIAHIHGGELSEGSLDDATRHCVTKLAHLHFVATREYGERVCQLGEEAWRVHVVGAPAIESIASLDLLDRDELQAELQIEELLVPLVALTIHPTSLWSNRAGSEAATVTRAVDTVLGSDGTVIVTLPNDDPGNAATRTVLLRWAASSPCVHAYASLGQVRYLSLLRHADAVVGNSSSAIIEAPSFRLPAVNVGDRQRGRALAANVISCPAEQEAIADALRTVLQPQFRSSLAEMKSPYGTGAVSRRILSVLAGLSDLPSLRDKRFFDLPDKAWRALKLGET